MEQKDERMVGALTKTELEVFDELLRDVCLVGFTQILGERQLLMLSTRTFESRDAIVSLW